jgi:hypothetical protein
LVLYMSPPFARWRCVVRIRRRIEVCGPEGAAGFERRGASRSTRQGADDDCDKNGRPLHRCLGLGANSAGKHRRESREKRQKSGAPLVVPRNSVAALLFTDLGCAPSLERLALEVGFVFLAQHSIQPVHDASDLLR